MPELYCYVRSQEKVLTVSKGAEVILTTEELRAYSGYAKFVEQLTPVAGRGRLHWMAFLCKAGGALAITAAFSPRCDLLPIPMYVGYWMTIAVLADKVTATFDREIALRSLSAWSNRELSPDLLSVFDKMYRLHGLPKQLLEPTKWLFPAAEVVEIERELSR